jgi:hypothetical protein
MRKEKTMIADLLTEESARNPDFAGKLERLLSDLPERKEIAKKSSKGAASEPLPDIYVEWKSRGEADFRLWIQDQPVSVLRSLIRSQDFDSARRTSKWKEAEKLATFIADGVRARLARGSAFIGRVDSGG